jgi:hypothetical protein
MAVMTARVTYISWLGEQDLAVKEGFYSMELSVSSQQQIMATFV